jgi:uncharacterized coiled-coil protein SlyX
MDKVRTSTQRKYKTQQQKTILELKSAITELKILVQGFNSRLDQAQERLSKFKNKQLGRIQSEREKRD